MRKRCGKVIRGSLVRAQHEEETLKLLNLHVGESWIKTNARVKGNLRCETQLVWSDRQ